MQFQIQRKIFTITLLLFLTKFNQSNGNEDENVFESTFQSATNEINSLREKIISVNSGIESIHSNLHLQTDFVSNIRNNIHNIDANADQCETSELFDDLDNKLHKIKQNLHKVINNHDDNNSDKMDSILQKVKADKSCPENDDTTQLEEIQKQILEKSQKFNQYVERLEILEEKFGELDKINANDSSVEIYKNIPDLDNIINEINNKLSSQEETLLRFDEHLNEMQNISSTIDTHLKSRREKSKRRCTKGKCLLYKLIEMDKSLNITKNV